MTNLFEAALINAAVAAALAIVVWLVTRLWRHPVLVHTLWVIVLVKLITPPIVSIPWRFAIAPTLSSASSSHIEAASDPSTERSNVTFPAAASMDFAVQSERQLDHRIPEHPTESIEVLKDAILADTQNGLAVVETASDPQQQPRTTLRWALLAMVIWLFGSILFICTSALRLICFHRALASTDPAPYEIQILAEEVATRFELTGRYRLRITEGRLPPLVWPLGQPTIVMPRRLLTQLSHDEIQTLLAHEFAHLRRHDHWIRWLELVVTAIYWWHPVVWWARSAIQKAEEEACDAWVVSTLPNSEVRYASALFKAVQFISEDRQAEPILASALGSSGELKERIEHVMNTTWQPRLLLPVRLSVLVAALLALPLSLRAVQATDEPAPSGDQADTTEVQEAAATGDAAVTEQAATNAQNVEEADGDDSDSVAAGAADIPQDTQPDPLGNILTGPITPDPQPAPKTPNRTPENAQNADAQALRIRPGTFLAIQVAGAPAAHPINQVYAVEPDGYVALGPVYGRVWLSGMTVSEAESALVGHLQTMLKDPRVQVIFVMGPDERRRVPVPDDPYHIAPGDVLSVSATGTYPDAPIADDYVVEPSGSVPLGPTYGRVKVVGMTLEDAEKAVAAHLRKQLTDPKVQVTIGGWRGAATSFVSPTPGLPDDPLARDVDLENALRQVEQLLNNELSRWGEGHPRVRQLRKSYDKLQGRLQKQSDLDSFRPSQLAPQPTQNVVSGPQRSPQTESEELNALREQVQHLENQLKKTDAQLRARGGSAFSQAPTYPEFAVAHSDHALAKDSVGVLKKYVERAQQDYGRLTQLAEKNAVSATEVARAQSDYEISVERLRQAERGLRYHRAVLEAAEADYEMLVETNKKAPHTITVAEMRRAKLAVELAKANLEVLSE